ncbi:MAG: Ig-like domain-containing protein [Bacteroidota bacterium]
MGIGNSLSILLFEKPSSDIYKIKVTGTGNYNLDSYLYNVSGQVTQTKYQGNLIDNDTSSHDINFDIIAPDVPTLLSPANSSYVKATGLTLDWSDVSDQSGPVNYFYKSSWNGGNYGPVSTGNISQINASGSSDRVYQWQVRACDSAPISNCSEWSEPWTVTIDSTKPNIPSGLTFSKTNNTSLGCNVNTNEYTIKAKWNASTDTNFSHYEYKSFNPTNGWIWNAGNIGNVLSRTGSFTVGEGTYGFAVRAVDKAGNYSDWTSETIENSCKITYDSTKPTITINPYITNDNSPKLTGNVNDNTANVSIKIGDNTFSANNNTDETWELPDNIIAPNLADGIYNVVAQATDTAGNIGYDSTINELTVDTVAPTAVYKHYVEGDEITNSLVYINDINKLSFTVKYTDSTPSSNLLKDSYVIFDAQSDGSFKFSQNGARAYCSWRTEPNLVSLSGNSFLLTDQEQFSNCKNNLDDGEYYMTHQVYDNAIRKDIPSITQFRDVLGLHFIIDKIMPTGNWVYPLGNSNISGIVNLNFQANDDSSGVAAVRYEYKVNDGVTAFIPIDSIWDTNPLKLDSYILRAIVTDNAGNEIVFDQLVQVSAIISNVKSTTPTIDSTVVTWTTDKPTKSRVVYDTVPHGVSGDAPNYGYAFSTGTSDISPKVTSHSITITGLADMTDFYYRVISEGSPVSIGEEYRFRTLSKAGSPDPTGNSPTVQATVLGANTTALKSKYNYLSDSNNVLGLETIAEPQSSPTPSPKPEVKGIKTNKEVWDTKNLIWISLGGLLALICTGLLVGRAKRTT